MKIAVDFDDVVAETMQAFLKAWNGNHPDNPLYYKDIADWGLAERLGVAESAIKATFAGLHYHNITAVPGAVPGVQELVEEGHEVVILSANEDWERLREWLNRRGFRKLPVVAGIKNKADYVIGRGYNVLIDDNPSTLKALKGKSVYTIRFWRPWNASLMHGDYGYNGLTWAAVLSVVRGLERVKVPPADFFKEYCPPEQSDIETSEDYDGPIYRERPETEVPLPPEVLARLGYIKRNLPGVTDTTTPSSADDCLQIPGAYQSPDQKAWKSIETGRNSAAYELSPTITNAKGAKQTAIGARFDLLAMKALGIVAEVLNKGAKKYGPENWKKLSVDEINNHTLAHLMEYQEYGNIEDMSHAATRALMALEIAIEELLDG